MPTKDGSNYLVVTRRPKVVTVLSEEDITMTKDGYAPIIWVRLPHDPTPLKMFINRYGIQCALEPWRKENGGKFTGLTFSIKYSKTRNSHSGFKLEKAEVTPELIEQESLIANLDKKVFEVERKVREREV